RRGGRRGGVLTNSARLGSWMCRGTREGEGCSACSVEGFETACCPAQDVCAFEQVDEQTGEVGGGVRGHSRDGERVGQLLDPGGERGGRDSAKLVAVSVHVHGEGGDRAAAAAGGFLDDRADAGEERLDDGGRVGRRELP